MRGQDRVQGYSILTVRKDTSVITDQSPDATELSRALIHERIRNLPDSMTT